MTKRRNSATIIDVKTSRTSPSHSIQMMLYQYAIPGAFRRYRDMALGGQVAYPDHGDCQVLASMNDSLADIHIPVEVVNSEFINKMGQLSAEVPARKVPSRSECTFCNITSADYHRC